MAMLKSIIIILLFRRWKEKTSVNIPDMICGYPVVAVAKDSQGNVGNHTCKGVITAKSKGECNIYVYAQNGVYKKVKVTVK